MDTFYMQILRDDEDRIFETLVAGGMKPVEARKKIREEKGNQIEFPETSEMLETIGSKLRVEVKEEDFDYKQHFNVKKPFVR